MNDFVFFGCWCLGTKPPSLFPWLGLGLGGKGCYSLFVSSVSGAGSGLLDGTISVDGLISTIGYGAGLSLGGLGMGLSDSLSAGSSWT